jgi:hypothetical protein
VSAGRAPGLALAGLPALPRLLAAEAITVEGRALLSIPENWGLAEIWPVERGAAQVRGLAASLYRVRVWTADGRSWLASAEVPPNGQGRALLTGPGR